MLFGLWREEPLLIPVLFYFLDARTGPFALLPPPSQAREDQAHCLCLDVDTASEGSWSPPWPWASLESLVQGSLGRHCPLPPPFRPGAILLQSAWGGGGSLGGRQTQECGRPLAQGAHSPVLG